MDLVTAAALATLIITGPARVIDGDTVVITDTFTSPTPIHVRLKGVDAAELDTLPGRQSRQAMIDIVGRSDLTCYLTGEKTYKREVGYCFTDAGVDINREIIARGAALACPHYDVRYLPFEQPVALAMQTRAKYCADEHHTATPPAPIEPPAPTLTPTPTPTLAPTPEPDQQWRAWALLGLIVIACWYSPVFRWIFLGFVALLFVELMSGSRRYSRGSRAGGRYNGWSER